MESFHVVKDEPFGSFGEGEPAENSCRSANLPEVSGMCCFTYADVQVKGTRIFARSLPEGRQVIVYTMNVDAPVEMAMVLPLPVKPGIVEKDLVFVSLKEYPEFFQAMEFIFASSPNDPFGSDSGPFASAEAPEPLKVQEVGAFEASFVPTVADFSRLDARFQLPAGTWDKLPAYRNFGFAVFKLKPGKQDVHPMAFSFPRSNPAALFFPTLHIHDGQVHAEEEFDHVLYCQKMPYDRFPLHDWEESRGPAHPDISSVRSKGIVHPRYHLYRMGVHGRRRNTDIVLA
jgi:hypothetical protein